MKPKEEKKEKISKRKPYKKPHVEKYEKLQKVGLGMTGTIA